MGFWKQRQIEELGRGYYSVSKHVCDQCVTDSFLQAVVRTNAENRKCDYCSRQEDNLIAAPLESILDEIVSAVKADWSDPDNEGIVFDSREGGYQVELLSKEELFDEIEWPTENEQLMDDIVNAMVDDNWCERSDSSYELAAARKTGWERFASTVKYKTRYVFYREIATSPIHLDSGIPAHQRLQFFEETLQTVDLRKTFCAGQAFHRVRLHGTNEFPNTSETLGPPPLDKTRTNRMSASGIPVFYGALDAETALEEARIHASAGQPMGTGSTFRLLRPISVLDFTALPEMPSAYDKARREMRIELMFLYHFVTELSKRIDMDGREHTEYVPTQILTEYIRHFHKLDSGDSVMGLIYPSSMQTGGKSIVLFLTASDCSDQGSENDHHTLVLENYGTPTKLFEIDTA